MKRMLNVMAIIAMIIAVGFVMVACETDETAPNPEMDNYNDWAIRISNYTKSDIIAFKGSIAAGNFIGGIPAGQTNWGMKNNPNLFPSTPAQFRVLFITKDQYDKNKNNLSAISNSILTQTFVFWNGNNGDNDKVYEVSGKLGGANTLQIWNTSNYNVEFREGGTAGPTIGYAQSGMTRTNLYVGDGDYLVYPVFQRVNTLRDIVETVIPRYGNGNPYSWMVNFGDGQDTMLALNLQQAANAMTTRSLGAASIVVDNGGETGVMFFMGNKPMTTPKGYQVINTGNTIEFIVDMPKTGTGASANYGESRNISNFRISMAGYEEDVTDEDGSKTFTILTDKMYTISVSGNGAAGTMKAVINISKPDVFKVDEDQITFTQE